MPCLDLASLCFDFSLLLLCLSTTRLRSWNKPQRDCLWLAAPRKRNGQQKLRYHVYTFDQPMNQFVRSLTWIYISIFCKNWGNFQKTHCMHATKRFGRYANCFTNTKRAKKITIASCFKIPNIHFLPRNAAGGSLTRLSESKRAVKFVVLSLVLVVTIFLSSVFAL